MLEWCEELICQVATPRCLEGHGWVGHHLAVPGHGHHLECSRWMGWSVCGKRVAFAQCSGVPLRYCRWLCLGPRLCWVGNYKSWNEEGKQRVGDFLPKLGKEMSLRPTMSRDIVGRSLSRSLPGIYWVYRSFHEGERNSIEFFTRLDLIGKA